MPEPVAHIFGYGSLINPASMARTLLEPVHPSALTPAVLEGYERSWSLEDNVRLDDGNETEVAMVFLNIVAREGSRCNGVVFPVSEESLHNFDRRERRYDRVDVSHLVSPPRDLPVYTFVGREPYIHPPSTAVVSSIYEGIVDDGLSRWGDEFRAEYEATTIRHPFRRVDDPFTFVSLEE